METVPFTGITYQTGTNGSIGLLSIGLVVAMLGGFLQSLTPAPGDDEDDTSGYV